MRHDTNILAIIVLYKTKLKDSKSFLSFSKSLENIDVLLDLFVYDNSPNLNSQDVFEQDNNWNIIYKKDSNNGGVSKAYNEGAFLAQKLGKRWILLLDQDTNFPIQTMQEYLFAIDKYPSEKLFAPIMLANQKTIISPCYFRFMRGFSAKKVDQGMNSLNKFSLINSGLCIDINAFKKNSGYKEQIKLDFSDHDFIRRFKKNVGDRFIVINLIVFHSLSSASKNNFNNDLIRFDYYLEGAKYISTSFWEIFFLKFNAGLRAMKLSVIHRKIGFLVNFFKWI